MKNVARMLTSRVRTSGDLHRRVLDSRHNASRPAFVETGKPFGILRNQRSIHRRNLIDHSLRTKSRVYTTTTRRTHERARFGIIKQSRDGIRQPVGVARTHQVAGFPRDDDFRSAINIERHARFAHRKRLRWANRACRSILMALLKSSSRGKPATWCVRATPTGWRMPSLDCLMIPKRALSWVRRVVVV